MGVAFEREIPSESGFQFRRQESEQTPRFQLRYLLFASDTHILLTYKSDNLDAAR